MHSPCLYVEDFIHQEQDNNNDITWQCRILLECYFQM